MKNLLDLLSARAFGAGDEETGGIGGALTSTVTLAPDRQRQAAADKMRAACEDAFHRCIRGEHYINM